MLRFQSVRTIRDGRVILDGIDLEITTQRTAIIGANGSGKSTLARLCNGIETPDEGRVTFGTATGRDLRRHIGFVFQNPDNQIVCPIVEEDLAFGLKAMKLPADEIEARITRVLDTFGISHLRTRLTHQLSGGEKQMVALAGVVVMEPEMIIFDEPTTLLDLRNSLRFMRHLASLPQPIMMISHQLDLLMDFDRCLLIEEGHIAADGRPADVIALYRDRARNAQ